MKRYLALFLILLGTLLAVANNQEDYTAYFEEAYKKNPSIPKGLLESIAWNNTRMVHIVPKDKGHDCLKLPRYYGVMGLVEDGKGYFQNTLLTVAKLSGYPVDQNQKKSKGQYPRLCCCLC